MVELLILCSFYNVVDTMHSMLALPLPLPLPKRSISSDIRGHSIRSYGGFWLKRRRKKIKTHTATKDSESVYDK